MSDQTLPQTHRITITPAALPWLMAAAVYAMLMLLGQKLLNDPDTYWQIALGDWIVTHRAVPHVDTFSSTMAGAPWISSQWLAQVLFSQAYAVAGWTGVVVLTASCIATAQGLMTRFLLTRLAPTPALVLSLAGFVLASPHMVARAHALALPIMVTWIALLIRSLDDNRKAPFAALPLVTLWANLHGGFTFGIFFIAPVALEALWRAAPSDRKRVFLHWAGFGLCALAAACITPYGYESILVTSRILGLGEALALIGEWRPQDFATLNGFELCLLAGIGFALLRGLTLPPIRILMLLGLLHMALSHGRNAEMLGLLAPLIIAAPLALQLGRDSAASPHAPATPWPVIAVLFVALTGASAALAQAIDYRPNARITPASAVAAIKTSGKSHLLNSYDFGGYLISAGLRPFIDGRTELYGGKFFAWHDRAVTLQDIDSFLKLLNDRDIDVTLLTPDTPAIGLLDRLKGWQRVYTDDGAVVHVRVEKTKDAELKPLPPGPGK